MCGRAKYAEKRHFRALRARFMEKRYVTGLFWLQKWIQRRQISPKPFFTHLGKKLSDSVTIKWGNIEWFSCFSLYPAVFIEPFFKNSNFSSYVGFSKFIWFLPPHPMLPQHGVTWNVHYHLLYFYNFTVRQACLSRKWDVHSPHPPSPFLSGQPNFKNKNSKK